MRQNTQLEQCLAAMEIARQCIQEKHIVKLFFSFAKKTFLTRQFLKTAGTNFIFHHRANIAGTPYSANHGGAERRTAIFPILELEAGPAISVQRR
jgi:hypothetical protein